MRFSVNHPKLVIQLVVWLTLLLATLAVLPSLWPQTFQHLHALAVDTDPENMLPRTDPVRVFHNEMKEEMSLHDLVVVGVTNPGHAQGVFNVESLRKVHALTEFALSLKWPDEQDPDKTVGVVSIDLVAPSTVDNIEGDGVGAVKFEWLMPSPPATELEARAVREKASRIPLLHDALVSQDGRALALYLPLTSKDQSYRVYRALREKIATFDGEEQFFITGLPVAEDVFGVEMFIQMAISAPLAMLVIFVLLLVFFRNVWLIAAPMAIALLSVIGTMAVLVVTGNTVHIMSSMIPIFIMPIAVVDSIHILSEFFDSYRTAKGRRATILQVMKKLFAPMLYTSLTTAAGFMSLALVPIPPVQVFGLLVAFGVGLAWALSISLIPAYIMLIPSKRLRKLGARFDQGSDRSKTSMARALRWIADVPLRRPGTILAVVALAAVAGLYGVTKIVINDNPIRWFTADHPIRVADRVLNQHFGGTYMAYLALQADETQETASQYLPGLIERFNARAAELARDVPGAAALLEQFGRQIDREAQGTRTAVGLLDRLTAFVDGKLAVAEGDAIDAWEELSLFVAQEQSREEVFKQPEALAYLADLQTHLLKSDTVGKATSVADIVKTVHRELLEGRDEALRIPDSASGVAQTLITYQNSHRPQDLWRFVTPDYRKAVIWVQLKSGDNLDMSTVAQSIDDYVAANPPPFAVEHDWFGLTHINVVWQHKMVRGMLEALIGSFLVVLIMMALLLRSILWGLLAMVPLTITMGVIYGVVGLIGKDYDMPVAVLSALALGMAVDFAVHFLVRTRDSYRDTGSLSKAMQRVFAEPARAIVRNILVVAIGFVPLLAAPLVPYNTVGVLIATILIVSGVATLLILPALLKCFERWLFPAPASRAAPKSVQPAMAEIN